LESDGPLTLALLATLTRLLPFTAALLTGLLMTPLSRLLPRLLLSAAALLSALAAVLAALVLLARSLLIRVHGYSLHSLPTRRQQTRRRLGSGCIGG
jgi:hypothetical protein